MRYTNRKAFLAHLHSLKSPNLPRLYLIISSDAFERKTIIERIFSALGCENEVTRLVGGETSAHEVIHELNSPSLLKGEPVVVVEPVDKKIWGALEPLCSPLSFGYLILAASGKLLASGIEKQGIVLDLSEEKPWEREKRRLEELQDVVRDAKKRITPDAAQFFCKKNEKDASAFAQQLQQLLCYTADKELIARADVEAIHTPTECISLIWQWAEQLIWHQSIPSTLFLEKDPSSAHSFLAALRQELYIGVKIHMLMTQHVPFSKWNSHFPRIWPKALEQKANMARQFTEAYFQKGLDLLFECEMKMKGSSISPHSLFVQFSLSLFSARL